jgi:hypothetical protein
MKAADIQQNARLAIHKTDLTVIQAIYLSMKGITLLSFISLSLFSACESGSGAKQPIVQQTAVQPPVIQQAEVKSADTILPAPPRPDDHLPFKVNAYLIYKDGSISDFDIINERNTDLWNIIIAEKPSNRTLVHLTGKLDSLDIKLSSNYKIATDSIRKSDEDIKYYLRDTGCEEVYIRILKNKEVVYKDTIFFRCGE